MDPLSRVSVTTAAAELSLLTPAELRAAVGATDGSRDAELILLGRGASVALARQCCVVDDGVNPPTLLRETVSETFRWTGCGPLRLARRPVTSVVSVTVDGVAVDAGDYEIAGGRNLYRLSDDELFDWDAGKIVVAYVAGFATAPADLKSAAAKLVTALASEAGRDPGLKRVSVPGVDDREYWVPPADDPFLSKEIADLISPYVERWI